VKTAPDRIGRFERRPCWKISYVGIHLPFSIGTDIRKRLLLSEFAGDRDDRFRVPLARPDVHLHSEVRILT